MRFYVIQRLLGETTVAKVFVSSTDFDSQAASTRESETITTMQFVYPIMFSMMVVNQAIEIPNQTGNLATDQFSCQFFDTFDQTRFPFITDYLRGYPVQYDLLEMNMVELERLLVDVKKFKLGALESMVDDALHHRFNPYMCAASSMLNLAENGKSVQRIGPDGYRKPCAVNGVLYSGTRYMEFDIVTKNQFYFMIGVTEYNRGNIRTGQYPGHRDYPGISYHGVNGQVYGNGGGQAFGPALNHGDKVGVFVDICEDATCAAVTFFVNGEKIDTALDLSDYMNIDGGVVFVVSLYETGDEIQIVQHPNVPQM